MRGFEPVTLSWQGQSYTVPAEGQLMLIAEIEDALRGSSPMSAVELLMRPGGPSKARLCMAYAAALKHAGAEAEGDAIYLHVMERLANEDASALVETQGAILGLLAIVAPPVTDALSKSIAGADTKKPQAAE